MTSLRTQYDEQGFVVVDPLLSGDEIAQIRREAVAICAGQRGQIKGVEPIAEPDPDESVMMKYLAIHFPHKISELIKSYLTHPGIAKTLTELIGPNVKCMQSMLFMKVAGKPGQAWHQDEYYIPTRDRSLIGVWIALDNATIENGCLWVIPGSHQPGVLWPMRQHSHPEEFDAGDESYDFPYDDTREAVPCEVRAGGVVFFNGYLLHRSLKNRAASGFRRALVNHCMRAESLLPWDWDGRLELKQDMRDFVMVAGQDPYAWKGMEDLTYPYLRADRQGAAV